MAKKLKLFKYSPLSPVYLIKVKQVEKKSEFVVVFFHLAEKFRNSINLILLKLCQCHNGNKWTFFHQWEDGPLVLPLG